MRESPLGLGCFGDGYEPKVLGGKYVSWFAYQQNCSSCQIADLSTDPLDPNGLKALSKQFNETTEQAQLTQSLEGGMNGYNLLSPKTQSAEQCLKGLIGSELSQDDSGYAVTSTVRTLAYQAHLRKLWDKFFELQRKIKSKPAVRQLCPALIAEVEGEMGFRLTQDPKNQKNRCTGGHCLRYQPAGLNPKHTEKIAFDINPATVDAYQKKYTIDIQRGMATAANACNLTWGGTYVDPDEVHFVCCVK